MEKLMSPHRLNIFAGSSILKQTVYTTAGCTGEVAEVVTAQYYTSCLLLAQAANSAADAQSLKTSIYAASSSSSSSDTWLSQGAVAGIVIVCLRKCHPP